MTWLREQGGVYRRRGEGHRNRVRGDPEGISIIPLLSQSRGLLPTSEEGRCRSSPAPQRQGDMRVTADEMISNVLETALDRGLLGRRRLYKHPFRASGCHAGSSLTSPPCCRRVRVSTVQSAGVSF